MPHAVASKIKTLKKKSLRVLMINADDYMIL